MEELLFFYRGWLNTLDAENVKNVFADILQKSNFQKLGFIEHSFSPQGYTCLWLLGESHLAIHTFPERNKMFFELCSCSKSKLLDFQEQLETHYKKVYQSYF